MRVGLTRRLVAGAGFESAYAIGFGGQSRFVAKARPEPDLRYASKARAVSFFENAPAHTNCQGRYLAVAGVVPSL